MADTAIENLTEDSGPGSRDDAMICKDAGFARLRQVNYGEAYFGRVEYVFGTIEFGSDGSGGNTATLLDNATYGTVNISSVTFANSLLNVNLDNRFGIVGSVLAAVDSNLAGLYEFGPTVVINRASYKCGKISTGAQVDPKTETGLQGGKMYVMGAFWCKPT